MNCPKCECECFRDSVDVEVGVIYGPYGCPECGWSESPEYDRSEGLSPAQKKYPKYYVDQWGGMTPIQGIIDKCSNFGIPKETVEEAFDI